MVQFTDHDRKQIKAALQNGGTHTMTIEASDIPMDANTEKLDSIAPYLTTGFELPPSSIVEVDKEAAYILIYSSGWTHIQVYVARAHGKIVYKKLPTGQYEATITV